MNRNVNARPIWERLAVGQALDDVIGLAPDEIYQWVKDTERDALIKFALDEFGIMGEYATIRVDRARWQGEHQVEHTIYEDRALFDGMAAELMTTINVIEEAACVLG
jgi:hypothetical protein